MMLAFFAVFLPGSWMVSSHRALGMGELPRAPIVEYLTRTLSALYGMHGGLLVVFATDVVRFLPAIRYTGAMNVVFGLLVLGVDLYARMPTPWSLVEGPAIVCTGVVLLFLSRRVGGDPG